MNPKITEEHLKKATDIYENARTLGDQGHPEMWGDEGCAAANEGDKCCIEKAKDILISATSLALAQAAHDAATRIIKRMDHCDCDFSDLRSHWHYCQTRNPLKMIEAARDAAEPYLKGD